jgi:hypothetical protein
MSAVTRHLGAGTTNDAANAIGLAGWTWALLPSSHTVFAGNPSFDAMRHLASQQVWGMVTLGLLIALVATLGDAHRATHHMALVACAALWALVATMILVSNTTAPGIGLYVAFSLLTVWRATGLNGGK